MNISQKVFYLYPEFEGQQHFVCWGFAKDGLDKKFGEEIKKIVLAGLVKISKEKNPWVSQRSFSVYLGEDTKSYWVAIPRQLTAKAMKHFSTQFSALNPEVVITSYNSPFGEKLPFNPVISYDRGFIYDSTEIEGKLVGEKDVEKIVNG